MLQMISHAGRKRNPRVIRDSKGKSRGEPEVIAKEVLAVRERHLRAVHVEAEHAKDQLSGTTLGRLLLRGRNPDWLKSCEKNRVDPGSISQAQFDAGDKWSHIVNKHAAIMGYKLSAPSPSFIMVSGTSGAGTEPDVEVVAHIRKQFTKCYNALVLAQNTQGGQIVRTTYGVCVDDRPVESMQAPDYGDLRMGLNALARVL